MLFVSLGTLRLDFLPNEFSDFCFFVIILLKGLDYEMDLDIGVKDRALSLFSEKKSLELSEVEKSPLLAFFAPTNNGCLSKADAGACFSSLVICVI